MRPIDQKIYLASKSPRRRELLRQIGVEFELLMLRENTARGPDVNEDPLPGEAPQTYVERITRSKLQFSTQVMVWRKLPPRPVLAADTTVAIDGFILGKPANAEQAAVMLRQLAGKTHQVFTSVALQFDESYWQTTQCSHVTFTPLSEEEILAYCQLQEPYDKAGGYAAQGQAARFISVINGSYSGIMGLPLHETAQLLRKAGVRLP